MSTGTAFVEDCEETDKPDGQHQETIMLRPWAAMLILAKVGGSFSPHPNKPELDTKVPYGFQCCF